MNKDSKSTVTTSATSPVIKLFRKIDVFSTPCIFILMLLNLCLTLIVIQYRNYTEIDWQAYMQQITTYLNGQRDYSLIKGGTGPLVYPAGFVYMYTFLYKLTDHGQSITTAQYIFALFHTISLFLTFQTYKTVHSHSKTKGHHGISFIFLLTLLSSRRLMSIYVLRLFNDGIQVMFMNAAILLFSQSYFFPAFCMYSLSLSIKMNALLYLPAIAVITSQSIGFLRFLLLLLFLIASQVVIAIPFLLESVNSYIGRAFEFSRVFLYKWSVNGAFLPEHIFTGKSLASALLLTHITVLLLFGHYRWTSRASTGLLGLVGLKLPLLNLQQLKQRLLPQRKNINPLHAVMVLYTCNFIGIVYARTLHYQFYAWYAHTLPLLVSQTQSPTWMKLGILIAIEGVFNCKSPNAIASIILQIAHFSLLGLLWRRQQVDENSIYTEREKTI